MPKQCSTCSIKYRERREVCYYDSVRNQTKCASKEAPIRNFPGLKAKIYMPTNDLPNNKIEHKNKKKALNKKDFVLSEFIKISF